MKFKGKKRQEEIIDIDESEEKFLEHFRGVEIPILTLDERWLTMFPDGQKSKKVLRLEKDLKEAFKYQAKLAEDLKVAESAKKQLMDRIIRNMKIAQISEEEAMLQEKSQEFIRELNERISKMESQYEVMPQKIKDLNEALLMESLRFCYRKMSANRDNIQKQEVLIQEAKKLLEERTAKKKEMQKQNERMYVFVHHLFGRNVLEIFNEFDEYDEDSEE
ncbi:MAG: hypothetical protein HDT30_01715 [Clostridiales bacterium]|nr:hypothetical protein [Clostridiales bacterium]